MKGKDISKVGMVISAVAFGANYIGYLIIARRVPTFDEMIVMMLASLFYVAIFSPIILSVWIDKITNRIGGQSGKTDTNGSI